MNFERSLMTRVSFAFFSFGKFFNIYTEGVIPARDAGIQSFRTVPSKTL